MFLFAPSGVRVDTHLANLLRPVLLRDVIEDQVPQLDVVVDRIELEVAILETDAPGALLARGVERVEVGLREWHSNLHLESHRVARLIRRRLLLRLLFGSRRWVSHTSFELGPMLLLKSVNADSRSRRTRVHPAVERLIALAHLLPFVPPVALHQLRDELLRRELLEVLLAVLRKMTVARGEGHALFYVLVRGPIEAQPPVQLLLGHAGVHWPHPNAALDPRAQRPDIHRRRCAEQRRRARVALDHQHAAALLSRPLVDLRGGEARIYGKLENLQLESRCRRERFVQQPRQLLPNLRPRGVALEHAVIDRPRFLAAPPRDNLDFDPILLNIRARREEQPAMRHAADLVRFPAVIKFLPLRSLAEHRPRLAENRVDEHLQQRRILLRLLELLSRVGPREPAYRRVQARQMEASRATIARRALAPFTTRQHPLLLVVVDLLPAVLANVNRILRFALRPPELRELQYLELAARWARDPVAPLVAFLKRRLDPAQPRDLRRRNQEDLPPRKGSRARRRQVDRVAFAFHIARISVHFVQEQIPRRHRPQAHGRVRPGHHQHAARELFRQNCVSRIARARAAHQLAQHYAFLDQRIDTLLRVALGHLDGGLHSHHRAGRLVDHIADPVVTALGAPDLTALHEHHALDRRRRREAVHDLAQIWRAVRAPGPGFRRRALGEHAVAVRPLRDGQQRFWPEASAKRAIINRRRRGGQRVQLTPSESLRSESGARAPDPSLPRASPPRGRQC